MVSDSEYEEVALVVLTLTTTAITSWKEKKNKMKERNIERGAEKNSDKENEFTRRSSGMR